MPKLKDFFDQKTLDHGVVAYAPVLRASVSYGSHSSMEVQGVIDTGAIINLAPMSLAKSLLGIDQNQVKKGRNLEICGVGSNSHRAYGFEVTLNLRATTVSTVTVSLVKAWLYFYEKELPYQMLIGQSCGLEGKAFFHLNGGRTRHWSLGDLR